MSNSDDWLLLKHNAHVVEWMWHEFWKDHWKRHPSWFRNKPTYIFGAMS